MIRINLWSGPRNISTALMYSFAQRSDTTVVDEPLYAHYLDRTDADRYHPGASEVLTSMERDGAIVVRDVILGDYATPIVFFKQMTHHLVELDLEFLDRCSNVILTRHPRDMLPSYAEQVSTPSLTDTGYPQQVALLDHLDRRRRPPVVIDARSVLEHPRRLLTRLCGTLGIGFDEAMMSWPEGGRPEDGVWAPHWYRSVHRSSGFLPYRAKTDPFPERLRPLLEACIPLYERLTSHSMRI